MGDTPNLGQLTRRYREGAYDEVRRALWRQLDAKKRLSDDGYMLLLGTYERGKPDARLDALIDERLAQLDRRGAKAVFRGARALVTLLERAKRWSDVLRVSEAIFTYAKDLAFDTHASMFEAARRLGPEAQARALAIHQRIVRSSPATLDVPAIARRARAAAQSLASAKPPTSAARSARSPARPAAKPARASAAKPARRVPSPRSS